MDVNFLSGKELFCAVRRMFGCEAEFVVAASDARSTPLNSDLAISRIPTSSEMECRNTKNGLQIAASHALQVPRDGVGC